MLGAVDFEKLGMMLYISVNTFFSHLKITKKVRVKVFSSFCNASLRLSEYFFRY